MADSEAALYAAGAALLGASVQKDQGVLEQQLRSQARAALKRADRKAQAIRGDIERASAAPQLRREGNLLLCNLRAVARGANSARLLDESIDPPEWVEFALDPARDAQQNAQQRFDRARKLERGIGIAEARLADAERECARLRDFLASLEQPEADDERIARAERLGLRAQRVLSAARRRETRVHSPYRTFVAAGERMILVGKGAADNDTLTLTVARPHDHWLHARGVHGAHVIVPRERGAELPPELLLDAAHLAAHFSDVRGEATAEIQHTERRYLRKPKGAAPGAINVDREKVLLLRIEPERLARLLASERS
jgi:predicted ribosome quality control (RQC) complex YloA/Tae2 family protein